MFSPIVSGAIFELRFSICKMWLCQQPQKKSIFGDSIKIDSEREHLDKPITLTLVKFNPRSHLLAECATNSWFKDTLY